MRSPALPLQYPRDLAVRVLTGVLSDRRTLDESLEGVLAQENLSGKTKAWLQDVCSGTLRWKHRLDWILDQNSLKKKPSGWLRKILLVAAYQLIVQERTAHPPVVSETVELIKTKEGLAPSQFANAVLRKLSEHAEQWLNLPWKENFTLTQASVWSSMPDWFWKKLVAQRGMEWSRRFAEAALQRPETWIRSLDSMPDAEKGIVPGAYKMRQGGAIPDLEGFPEGRFFVQDISSQFLVHEISQALKKEGPRTVLDLCASPGGKTMGLAWNGFQVTSSDVDGRRLELLNQNLTRTQLSKIQVLPSDQLSAVPPQDLVWVDAPCSGSGIIRRHPDIKTLRGEKDLAQLSALQKKLLGEGLKKVKPAGFLVYSVCSVFKEEGEEVIRAQGLQDKIENQWLLSPGEAPYGDGFWACLIKV